jgi:hypothetical protein
MNKCRDKKCDNDKVCNPESGRCVLKSGKIGKQILAKKSRSRSPKSPKRKSPKAKSPKRKSPKRKSSKRKSSKRKSPKHKSPKRKSPKRKSSKRKSPKRKSSKRKSPKHKSPFNKCSNVVCDIIKVCNPSTGRCVLKSGKIGKQILLDRQYEENRPKDIIEQIKNGKDEVKHDIEEKFEQEERIPSEFNLNSSQTCGIPMLRYDKGSFGESYILYSIEELINKLDECKLPVGRYSNDYETLKNMGVKILTELSSDENLSDIISISSKFVRKKYYNMILTPQLKGNDFKQYSDLVNRLKSKICNGNSKQIKNPLKELLIESIKYPQSVGIFIYLENLYYNIQLKNYVLLYYKIYKEIINLLRSNYKREFNDKVIENDNPPQITLKKGTIFYRGIDSKKLIPSIRNKFWIAYDMINSSNYIVPSAKYIKSLAKWCDNSGGIEVYRLTENIKLPNMKNVNTVKTIGSNIYDNKLKTLYNYAFSVISDNSVYRKSTMNGDAQIVNWMCANGYTGFTASDFDMLHGGLYSEVFLCEPKKVLEYVGYYNFKDLGNDFCDKQYTDQDIVLSL